MGVIRFLLAAAVLFGHAPGWGKLSSTSNTAGFILPYYAVQGFFVISGFYMALIHEKYAGLRTVFYINRYSRLAVSYWIVAAATIVFELIYPDNPFSSIQELKGHAPALAKVALIFSNVSMIGQDCIGFFTRPDSSNWFLIPQGWSLGTELWFYLLVPFIAPLRLRWIILMFAMSVALRLVLIGLPIPFWPWQQRFFPAELAFFLSGIMCYRFYRKGETKAWFSARLGRIALAVAALMLCEVSRLPFAREPVAWNSFLLIAVLFVLIPPIFHASRNSRIDRFIGEFSYPIYLWHILIGTFIPAAQRLWQGGFLLLLSVLFSLPMVLIVEVRLENWRHRRLIVAKRALPHKGLPDARLVAN